MIISRVPQSLPIRARVDLWARSLEDRLVWRRRQGCGFLAERPAGRLFELLASGEIVAWEIREL